MKTKNICRNFKTKKKFLSRTADNDIDLYNLARRQGKLYSRTQLFFLFKLLIQVILDFFINFMSAKIANIYRYIWVVQVCGKTNKIFQTLHFHDKTSF